MTILRWACGRRGRDEDIDPAVRSILVVELTRLGDLLVTIPALHALRRHYPGATIEIAIDRRYAGLVELAAPGIGRIPVRAPRSPFSFLREIVTLRRKTYDLSLSMSPAKRNAAFTLSSRARFKVGYLAAEDSLTPYLSETNVEAFGRSLVQRERYGRENIADRPAKVLRAMGVGLDLRVPVPVIPDEVRERIETKLEVAGFAPHARFVAIQPFSGWDYRTWSGPNFALLAEKIVTGQDLEVVFFYPPEERSSIVPLRSLFGPSRRAAFVETAGLLEAAALIRRSLLFVGNDSGPLHLATLLGTPSIGLFGPASPELTGPRSQDNIYLHHLVECSPCDQRRCIRPENPCIQEITPDEVMVAVDEALRRPSPARMVKHG